MISRDWSEDFEHENGCYQNNCVHCGKMFRGHKRRVACRLCGAPRIPRPDQFYVRLILESGLELMLPAESCVAEYPEILGIVQSHPRVEARFFIPVKAVEVTAGEATLCGGKAGDFPIMASGQIEFSLENIRSAHAEKLFRAVDQVVEKMEQKKAKRTKAKKRRSEPQNRRTKR